MKEGEHMSYRVAIVDDSTTDAEFVQGILNSWADLRQANIQAEVFPSAEAFLFRYAEDKDSTGSSLYTSCGSERRIVTSCLSILTKRIWFRLNRNRFPSKNIYLFSVFPKE